MRPDLGPRDDRLPSWLLTVGRWRWVILLLAGVLPGVWHLRTTGDVGDWNFFRDGARTLAGESGMAALSLYVTSPETQIGPPGLLLVLPLAMLPEQISQWAVVIVLGAALPACCLLLERALGSEARNDPHTGLTVLSGGAFVAIYWWRQTAEFAHPEDVLAVLLAFLVLCWSRTTGSAWTPWVAATLLGTAAAGKPWAVGLLPLVAVWAGPLVVRGARIALGGLVALAWWAPFVIGAPGTLASLNSFRVDVWASSPLAVLGLAGAPYPEWVRPTQFGLAFLLASVAVARRRAHLVPFAVVAARLAVDPQAWDYYFAAVAVACLAVDLFRTNSKGPWLTMTVVFVLYDVRWLADASVGAALQVVPLVIVCLLLVAEPWSRQNLPRRSATGPRPLERA